MSWLRYWNLAVSFDLKYSDRFNCHFLKSYAYSDLKALLWNKSLGGTEYSYEASLETDITSKLLWSTERHSCEYKDMKGTQSKISGEWNQVEKIWERWREKQQSRLFKEEKLKETEKTTLGFFIILYNHWKMTKLWTTLRNSLTFGEMCLLPYLLSQI